MCSYMIFWSVVYFDELNNMKVSNLKLDTYWNWNGDGPNVLPWTLNHGHPLYKVLPYFVMYTKINLREVSEMLVNVYIHFRVKLI